MTATLSGVLGLGGGVLLLTVMAAFFPPTALIPLHGIVQLTSNLTRAVLNRGFINWRISGAFAIGAVAGAAAGSQVVVSLDERFYQTTIGILILVMIWMPPFRSAPRIPAKFFFVGGGTTFLSLFLGATGPLLVPFFLQEKLNKNELVATQAATTSFLHLFKVGAFVALGFAIGPHLVTLALMVAAAFIGSFFGKFLLDKLPEAQFRLGVKIVVTLLALRMIFSE